jgi:hypothetical protein
MLEELRLHGVYEEINQKIDFYLKANTVTQLYEKILERLETVREPPIQSPLCSLVLYFLGLCSF